MPTITAQRRWDRYSPHLGSPVAATTATSAAIALPPSVDATTSSGGLGVAALGTAPLGA